MRTVGRTSPLVKSIRRPDTAAGWVLLEGPKLVQEALDAGIELGAFLIAPKLVKAPLARTLEGTCPGGQIDEGLLRQLSETKSPQGLLALGRFPAASSEALSGARHVLGLDAVQDPGNVGTLLRSALAFGIDAVLIGPGTARPQNPKVVRSSAGAAFRLPIIAVDDLYETAQVNGWTVVLADPHEGVLLPEYCWPNRFMLVLGNEGEGLSAKKSGQRVRIPMATASESLNVAVAGSLLLYSAGTVR